MADGKGFKRGSAEFISDLLSEKKLKEGLEYLQSEEFKADRDRARKKASEQLKTFRRRYGSKRRTPETVARERELTLRLADVEAESAELRVRLSELLGEEEKIRSELESL